jgi:hypothetical protein
MKLYPQDSLPDSKNSPKTCLGKSVVVKPIKEANELKKQRNRFEQTNNHLIAISISKCQNRIWNKNRRNTTESQRKTE